MENHLKKEEARMPIFEPVPWHVWFKDFNVAENIPAGVHFYDLYWPLKQLMGDDLDQVLFVTGLIEENGIKEPVYLVVFPDGTGTTFYFGDVTEPGNTHRVYEELAAHLSAPE